jgi:tRNA A37 methylthiotransferase MiaB
VGERAEVLVEGEGRKGNLKGRTRTNKLVHFAGDLQPGAFADVAITAAHPHHLDARLQGSLRSDSAATPVGAAAPAGP